MEERARSGRALQTVQNDLDFVLRHMVATEITQCSGHRGEHPYSESFLSLA